MIQLSAQDTQFFLMESKNNLSTVTTLAIFQKPNAQASAFDLIASHVKSRLHTSSIFTRKLFRLPFDSDFPYWVDDDDFTVDHHLFARELPEPADWHQLCELVGEVHSSPLDLSRPLWEFHIADGLKASKFIPDNCFALIMKLHHAAVDGAAMMNFMAGLTDIDDQGTPLVDLSVAAEPAGSPPTLVQLAQRAMQNHTLSPINIAKTLGATLPLLANSKNPAKESGEKTKVPRTLFNRHVGKRKAFDAIECELATLKFIQQGCEGAKVNDVVLAICSGATRKYLVAHQDLPAQPLVAWVPVNVRPSGGEQAQKGNDITAMAIKLHTGFPSALARLKAITEETQRAKAQESGVSARLITDITKQLTGPSLAMVSRLLIASGITSKLCNLAVSNVPGARQTLYMNGAKCLSQFGLTPLADGMGLFIVTLSYNGTMTFAITSTKDVIPDMDFFCDCLNEAIAELVAETEAHVLAKT